MAMYQYSFANTDLVLAIPDSVGNYRRIKVEGYPTGENLINVTRRAPIANVQWGAYGDMIVNLQRIKGTDLVFPLLMNAPENVLLQDYVNYVQAQADADGAAIYPIQAKLTDNMGNDSVTLVNGITLAIPGMSRGQTMSTVPWVLTFERGLFRRGEGVDGDSIGQ